MQDVKLAQDENGVFDIVIENDGIGAVDGFETSIITSLMTDARAPSQLVPEAHQRRGWVGDIINAESWFTTGSTLWLLDQARMTSRTFTQAQLYTISATQHFITNRNARNVNVNVVPSASKIDIEIEIIINENTVERYVTLWRLTNASGFSNI